MNLQFISSTQENVPLSQAPSTAFVVTGDQIRRWGIRRLSELIERLVPGAISAEDFDDIILSFRGITADSNLKVLLLINGHEYNTQWNNGPSSEAELGLMDDIDKVEVLVGPHTAVYGSSALLGVINMITRNGRNFSGMQVSANYGSGDYKRGGIIAADRVNTKLDYLVSAGGLAADGYDNNNNGPLNISRFPPSWRFYANVNYSDFEFISRFTSSSRVFYNQLNSTTRPNIWTNYDTFFVTGRKTFQVNQDLRYVLDLSYDAIQTQRHDFTLGTKLRAVGEDRYGLKLTTFFSPRKNHRFVMGGYYRRDEFGDDWDGDNFNFSTTILNGQVTGIPADPYTRRVLTPYGRNTYALFGQDSISLNEQFSVLIGFRYDRVEAPQIKNPDSFSPRLALVVTPNKKTVLKAMFTSGVSRQLNAANTSPDAIAFGNPTIVDIDQPERLNSFELAASYRANPKMDFSLSAFYNSFRDILGVDPAQPGPAPPARLINFGRIDYVGFEAMANLKPSPRMFVRAIYQHVQFGSVVNDIIGFLPTSDKEHPSNYPEHVTKLLADVRLNKHFSINTNANLVWNHFGVFPNLQTEEVGFYCLLNGNIVWELDPRTELIISGYNLLNDTKRIPPFGLPPAFNSFAFLPERNFNVNLSYHF